MESRSSNGDDLVEDDGFVPPDPDEPPPVELWSAVGDVTPWGTVAVLLAWAAVFAWFAVRGEFGDRTALIAWGANVPGRDALDTAWRLLASTFLHGGAAHVFFNATSMLIFGPTVERLFARGAFWIVYVAGGAAGSLGSLLWREYRDRPDSLSVGGSGAIFALGGAVLIAAWRLRHRLAVGRARALGAALLFLLINGLVSGFDRHGTDNAGHAAGLAGGIAIGALLPLSERLSGRRAALAMRLLGAIALLVLVATLAVAIWRGASNS